MFSRPHNNKESNSSGCFLLKSVTYCIAKLYNYESFILTGARLHRVPTIKFIKGIK